MKILWPGSNSGSLIATWWNPLEARVSPLSFLELITGLLQLSFPYFSGFFFPELKQFPWLETVLYQIREKRYWFRLSWEQKRWRNLRCKFCLRRKIEKKAYVREYRKTWVIYNQRFPQPILVIPFWIIFCHFDILLVRHVSREIIMNCRFVYLIVLQVSKACIDLGIFISPLLVSVSVI